MRDYAEPIAELRLAAERKTITQKTRDACRDAADAIEELVAMVCPHYHRNVHDRGDDSYCDVLNTEPPKEETE